MIIYYLNSISGDYAYPNTFYDIKIVFFKILTLKYRKILKIIN